MGLAGMGEGGASMPPETDVDAAGVGVEGVKRDDDAGPGVLGRDELGVTAREGVVDLESAGLRGLLMGGAKMEKERVERRKRVSSRGGDECRLMD